MRENKNGTIKYLIKGALKYLTTALILVMLMACLMLINACDSSQESTEEPSTAASEGLEDESVNPLDDMTAPEITGVKDIEITQGEEINYMETVTVTDNQDTDPELEIDASAVDPDTPGEYEITYTARDCNGNETTVSAKVIVSGKVEIFEDYDEMKRLALQVVDECVDENADEISQIYSVFWWVKIKTTYSNKSDKTSWVNEAIRGFKTRTGDCFTYCAMLKALLYVMDYETIIVERSGGESSHYWLLIPYNGQYYHIDSCSRSYEHDKNWYCFLRTDEEVLTWSEKYDGYYYFDTEKYPASATTPLNLGWMQNHSS